MKEMVCGFLFYRGTICPEPEAMSVVLMLKARPEWQKGKLNGVGGKVEEGETPDQAMSREFREETGVTEDLKWEEFCEYACPGGVVHFFKAFTDKELVLVSEDGEEIPGWYPLPAAMGASAIIMIPNLKYLLPMAVDKNSPFAHVGERV